MKKPSRPKAASSQTWSRRDGRKDKREAQGTHTERRTERSVDYSRMVQEVFPVVPIRYRQLVFTIPIARRRPFLFEQSGSQYKDPESENAST